MAEGQDTTEGGRKSRTGCLVGRLRPRDFQAHDRDLDRGKEKWGQGWKDVKGLKVCTPPPGDHSSVPSTNTRLLTTACNSCSGDLTCLASQSPVLVSVCRQTHTYSYTYTHIHSLTSPL